jgi:16S rRNA (guanine527-N7)-methyltransferase
LTANKEFSQIVSLHLLDSLVVVNPLLREAPHLKNILDVGSGAGLPGVVLAIALPHVQVHCVDAVAKKAAFIHQVAISLKLKNLSAHHSRIEAFEGCYDLIASRAFSSLVDFAALTRKNISQSGIWLAMKARVNPEDEGPLPEGVELFHVEPLRVPDLEATRSIVWLKNKQ